MLQQMSQYRKQKNAERLSNCKAKLEALENQKQNQAEAAEGHMKDKSRLF